MSIVAERLRAVLEPRGVSQSELARAVGSTQGAISLILLGKTTNSRLLPKIATYLGVPLAWLLGMSDEKPEPQSDSAEPTISPDEALLLRRLRALAPQDRRAALRVTGGFIDSRLHDDAGLEFPAEPILAQMFEGILAGINPDAKRAEQALLLAQSLPTALAQTREFQNPTKVHRPAPRRGAPAAPTQPAEEPQRQST